MSTPTPTFAPVLTPAPGFNLSDLQTAALAMLPYPSYLPAPISHIAAIAERAEAHLLSFFHNVPAPTLEQVHLSTQALWRLMSVRKTLHLLIFPGADKRHRRGKKDETLTYLELRTRELQDYLAQFQSLNRSLRKKPEFGVPPSGGSSNDSSSIASPSSSASSAPQRFNSPSPAPAPPSQCPTLRSPATTVRAADRQAARLAKAAGVPIVPGIPRDPNFESKPAFTAAASALSDSPDIPHTPDMSYSSYASYSCPSSPTSSPSPQSENPCPLPESPEQADPQPERITHRNRRYTLTGDPLPPNNLPPLPEFPLQYTHFRHPS